MTISLRVRDCLLRAAKKPKSKLIAQIILCSIESFIINVFSVNGDISTFSIIALLLSVFNIINLIASNANNNNNRNNINDNAQNINDNSNTESNTNPGQSSANQVIIFVSERSPRNVCMSVRAAHCALKLFIGVPKTHLSVHMTFKGRELQECLCLWVPRMSMVSYFICYRILVL